MAFFDPLGFNQQRGANSAKKKAVENDREQYANAIKNLRKTKHNSKCADCLANGVPFVVMNFGIFICTNCSGTHRKYGNRVKSIRLDYFKQTEVDILSSTGNNIINAKYLANYDPKNNKYPLKNSYEWSTEQREQFIHDKYIGKLWYDKYAEPKDAPRKKKRKKRKKKKKKHSSDAPQNTLPNDTKLELQQTFMNITNAAANLAMQVLAKNDWDIEQAMDDFYGNLYEDSSDEGDDQTKEKQHVTPGGPTSEVQKKENMNHSNGNMYNNNHYNNNNNNNNNNNYNILGNNNNNKRMRNMRGNSIFDQKYDDDPFGLLSATVSVQKPMPQIANNNNNNNIYNARPPPMLPQDEHKFMDDIAPPKAASNTNVTPGGPASDFAVQEAQKQIDNLQMVITAQKQLITKYQAKIKGFELQIDKFMREKAMFAETLKQKEIELHAVKEEAKNKQMGPGNYFLWTSDDVIQWMLSLDQQFRVYQNKLTQSIRHENIKGTDLSAINENDLHRFGISDFQHKKRLLELIQILIRGNKRQPPQIQNQTDLFDSLS